MKKVFLLLQFVVLLFLLTSCHGPKWLSWIPWIESNDFVFKMEAKLSEEKDGGNKISEEDGVFDCSKYVRTNQENNDAIYLNVEFEWNNYVEENKAKTGYELMFDQTENAAYLCEGSVHKYDYSYMISEKITKNMNFPIFDYKDKASESLVFQIVPPTGHCDIELLFNIKFAFLNEEANEVDALICGNEKIIKFEDGEAFISVLIKKVLKF